MLGYFLWPSDFSRFKYSNKKRLMFGDTIFLGLTSLLRLSEVFWYSISLFVYGKQERNLRPIDLGRRLVESGAVRIWIYFQRLKYFSVLNWKGYFDNSVLDCVNVKWEILVNVAHEDRESANSLGLQFWLMLFADYQDDFYFSFWNEMNKKIMKKWSYVSSNIITCSFWWKHDEAKNFAC